MPADEESPGNTSGWVWGALINVSSQILINLGMNLIKRGQADCEGQDEPPPGQEPVSVKRFFRWQVGVACYVVGNGASFASMSLAPQSLLSALRGVQFVVNIGFARCINGERATWAQVAGTVVVVLGLVIVVLFGVYSNPTRNADDMEHLFREPLYLIYAASAALLTAVGYGVYWRCLRLIEATGELPRLLRTLMPLCFAAYAGMIGQVFPLGGKILMTMIKEVFLGDVDQLKGWFFWFMLVLTVGAVVVWTALQNKGLKMFDALTIVPALQIFLIVSGMLNGLLYWREYEELIGQDPDHPFEEREWFGVAGSGPADIGLSVAACCAFFFVGMALILAAAVMMAPRSDATDDETDPAAEPLLKDPRHTQLGPADPAATLPVEPMPTALAQPLGRDPSAEWRRVTFSSGVSFEWRAARAQLQPDRSETPRHLRAACLRQHGVFPVDSFATALGPSALRATRQTASAGSIDAAVLAQAHALAGGAAATPDAAPVGRADVLTSGGTYATAAATPLLPPPLEQQGSFAARLGSAVLAGALDLAANAREGAELVFGLSPVHPHAALVRASHGSTASPLGAFYRHNASMVSGFLVRYPSEVGVRETRTAAARRVSRSGRSAIPPGPRTVESVVDGPLESVPPYTPVSLPAGGGATSAYADAAPQRDAGGAAGAAVLTAS